VQFFVVNFVCDSKYSEYNVILWSKYKEYSDWIFNHKLWLFWFLWRSNFCEFRKTTHLKA